MKLSTQVVEKPWGRSDLPPVFGAAPGRQVGEVWFDAPGGPLPILVKWLFTSERLSIQVHPDDAQARARGLVSGKEECWVVVSAEPGAMLGIGTHRELAPAELREAALSSALEAMMDWKPVRAGDFFYIPAGTVHAIGAGLTLIEVQQNADVTYRLYDYGRPRALHLDDGVAVSRSGPYRDPRHGQLTDTDRQLLAASPHFTLWHARDDAIAELCKAGRRTWVVPVAGEVSAGSDRAVCGECLCGDDPVTAMPGTRALVAWEGNRA